MSEQESDEPTQPTQPQGKDEKTGKPFRPIEIPVPKRGEVDRLLSKAAKPPRKP